MLDYTFLDSLNKPKIQHDGKEQNTSDVCQFRWRSAPDVNPH